MCLAFRILTISTALLTFLVLPALAQLNRIEGAVRDNRGQALGNVVVELQNDYGATVEQVQTSSSGRFTFAGLAAGHWTVKVSPYGTNFEEQSQDLELESTSLAGDTGFAEFLLKPRKNSAEVGTEAAFIQAVPPAAKKLFLEGATLAIKEPEKGRAKVEQAIETFPDYFDAHYTLGRILDKQKRTDEAVAELKKAIEINAKSYAASFSLASILYREKKYAEAFDAAGKVVEIRPGSASAQLLYGSLLRIGGKLEQAETSLLKANELAEGKNAEAHWQLALLYNRTAKNQQAISELQTYLKLNPNSPDRKNVEQLIEKLKSARKQ